MYRLILITYHLLSILAAFKGSGWVGQASQTTKEHNRTRNRTMLCASHKTMQVIPATMHVTNLIAMVIIPISVETRRRLDSLLVLAAVHSTMQHVDIYQREDVHDTTLPLKTWNNLAHFHWTVEKSCRSSA